MTDSNCRPSRCKRDALPTELIAPPLFQTLRSADFAGIPTPIDGVSARKMGTKTTSAAREGRPTPYAVGDGGIITSVS